MKVANAGPGVQSDRNQEDRPGQKAGKHSSTAQRLTLHSNVCGAASHGSKLWRCLRHRQRRSSSLVVVRPAGVHNDAASRGRAGAAAVLGCVLRWPSPPRVLRELGRGEMNFRCHTRGQAFGIGSSVMASPLLEIKPKPDWAQHAHRTRSRPSLIFRATAQHISRLGAMTCWRPPRPGLGSEPQPAAPRAANKRMHVAKRRNRVLNWPHMKSPSRSSVVREGQR
jgi:hypothetical protein